MPAVAGNSTFIRNLDQTTLSCLLTSNVKKKCKINLKSLRTEEHVFLTMVLLIPCQKGIMP